MTTLRRVLVMTAVAAGVSAAGGHVAAQEGRALGRAVIDEIEFPPVEFTPPEVAEHTVENVPVLHLEDRALPLVQITVHFEGGYSHFPRDAYAAGLGLGGLLRSGGSTSFPPDSLDALLERFAVQLSFTSAGGHNTSTLNVLTEHVDTALAAWGDLLRRPAFDERRVEVWRGQQLERARRSRDDVGSLAFSVFNRLMYGDHPVGWHVTPADLSTERVSLPRLKELHSSIFCRQNLTVGVTGDLSWEEWTPILERFLGEWPSCSAPLPPIPNPDIRTDPGVFFLESTRPQSTVILAHTTDVNEGANREYFASRIGSSILGTSGFSSRLTRRLRTEEGLTYSASSLWTAPVRGPGLFGAVTATNGNTASDAALSIIDVIDSMRAEAPAGSEVESAVARYVNGFVFNFETPAQIVSRRVFYRAVGLPDDWLERYLEGMRIVQSHEVLDVFREHVDSRRMTVLVVGDRSALEGLDRLGPVTSIDLDGRPLDDPTRTEPNRTR